MSNTKTPELPLWVQDRENVINNNTDIQWRDGKPDYAHTNQFLEQERQCNHAEGSLNAIAHNLVKTFEMEATHKTNPKQWMSIVTDKFRMSSNGGKQYTAQDIIDAGTYNLFLPKMEHYDPATEDFDSSYDIFHTAFPEGFHWELLEVILPPPQVVFKWRHWGNFKGKFKDFEPTGETIEMIGVSVACIDKDLKIESVQHFFDNTPFLEKLTAGGCPFHNSEK